MIDPDYRLPSVDEVLGGQTQGGVPRPAVLDDEWLAAAPKPDWQARSAAMTRWQAIKALIRIIFMGDRP